MGHCWDEGMAQKLGNSEFLFDLDASRFFGRVFMFMIPGLRRLPNSLFY
jgi:hypothetical protein